MAAVRQRWLIALGTCLALLCVPLIALFWLGTGSSVSHPPPPATRPSPRPSPPPSDAEPTEGARLVFGTIQGPDEQPIAGAEVSVDGMDQPKTFSEADGSYRLQAAPLGELEIVVRANGHAEARVTLQEGDAGSEARLDVALEASDGVAGVVVDPEGAPVSGASVGCADRPDDRLLAAVSDGEGRFQLPDRAAGCKGFARHERFGDAAEVILRAGKDNRLALSEPAAISGVVVDERGAPVPNFVVAIESFRAANGRDALKRGYRQPFDDAEGRFTVPGLQAGRYVLSATTEGRPPEKTRPIEVASAEHARGVRIVLRRGGVLEGIVSDESGEPVAGARVSLDAQGFNARLATRTDAEGHYRLEGVPTEPFSVRAEAAGFVTRIVSSITARPGATTKRDFSLAPGVEGESKTEYTGIGAMLANSPDGVIVGQVFEGGPAERAGLEQRDLILAVDGARTDEWTVTDAVQRLRGPVDSRVSLRVRRDDGVHEITIVRERFVR